MGIFPGENLINTKAVAERLNISPSTVRGWVFLKKIPFVKFGRGKKSLVRFNPKVLNEWVEENSREPVLIEDQLKKFKDETELKKASRKTVKKFNDFIGKITK